MDTTGRETWQPQFKSNKRAKLSQWNTGRLKVASTVFWEDKVSMDRKLLGKVILTLFLVDRFSAALVAAVYF